MITFVSTFNHFFYSHGFCLLKKQIVHQTNNLHNDTCSTFFLSIWFFWILPIHFWLADWNLDLRMWVDSLLGTFLWVSSVHGIWKDFQRKYFIWTLFHKRLLTKRSSQNTHFIWYPTNRYRQRCSVWANLNMQKSLFSKAFGYTKWHSAHLQEYIAFTSLRQSLTPTHAVWRNIAHSGYLSSKLASRCIQDQS